MRNDTNPSPCEQLKNVTEVLLSEPVDYLELKNATDTLKELFVSTLGLSMESETYRENIYLENGKAIGPFWAAACIDDMIRTKRFVSGVRNAIRDSLNRSSGPVRVLYAGTGPFATLVLPLITVFEPDEVQFSLIEINPISFEHVQDMFAAFGASAYVASLHNEDASTVMLEKAKQFDVVVVECLQHSLNREPQVAIAHNLIKQCREDVIMVPENITLRLGLIDFKKQMDHLTSGSTKDPLGFITLSDPVFVLSGETMRQTKLDDSGILFFPGVETKFTSEELRGKTALAITTEIQTYGDQFIKINESGLTVPVIQKRFDGELNELQLQSRYMTGAEPELIVTIPK